MLYRLMVDRGHPEFATEQAVWLAIGLACFVGHARDHPRHPPARRLHVHDRARGADPAAAADRAGRRHRDQRRASVGEPRVRHVPAGGGRAHPDRDLPRVATCRSAGSCSPPASGASACRAPKDLGPILLAWGASLIVLFLERDMGASLLLFGVFVVMLWVATGRWSYLVLGLDPVRDRRLHRLPRVLARAGARRRVAARDGPAAWSPTRATSSRRAGSRSPSGGMVGTGLGLGSPTLIPYVGSDFILAAFGEELGMLGVAAMLLLVPRARRARAADRGRAPRRLREAARGRAHDRCSGCRCS